MSRPFARWTRGCRRGARDRGTCKLGQGQPQEAGRRGRRECPLARIRAKFKCSQQLSGHPTPEPAYYSCFQFDSNRGMKSNICDH
mmetsp:Transcript_21361/g.62287  ORF Transcript_21361/g.62287 Transcript_21361/m.62287 type:complete len:85 (-) Transcript_21361:84-338(-)